jgi:hypothetical protein
MHMDRRKIAEYTIIILLIIALGVLIWFLLGKDKSAEPVSPTNPDIVRSMPRADQVFTPEQIAAAKPTPEIAGRIFAERFGSYSNQGAYGNIEDVFVLVTPELKTSLEALRVSAEAELSEKLYGVNTRIISVEKTASTDTTAELSIQTQREEEVGTPGNTRVYYQKIALSMQKVGDAWLVAKYTWE